MDWIEIVKLIGSGGFGVALLGLLFWLGQRGVAAMDALRASVDQHRRETSAAIGAMRTDLAVMGARVEEWSDRIELPPELAAPERPERPSGVYSINRPGSRGVPR